MDYFIVFILGILCGREIEQVVCRLIAGKREENPTSDEEKSELSSLQRQWQEIFSYSGSAAIKEENEDA